MEDKRKEAEKSLDDFQNKVLEITTSAINEKQKEINLWRNRALKLARKFQACLDCGEQGDYIISSLQCRNCELKIEQEYGE